jgi:WXXGXW repeat (2 copies)
MGGQSMSKFKLSILPVALALILSAAGCAHRTRRVIVYVPGPPPPPVHEVIAVAPGAGYVWIPGYHRWSGSSYVWVGGHYELRPRGRRYWVPGRWARERRGWIWIEGYWR